MRSRWPTGSKLGLESARRAMVDIFEVLGPHDMLTQRYQGELAKLLYA